MFLLKATYTCYNLEKIQSQGTPGVLPPLYLQTFCSSVLVSPISYTKNTPQASIGLSGYKHKHLIHILKQYNSLVEKIKGDTGMLECKINQGREDCVQRKQASTVQHKGAEDEHHRLSMSTRASHTSRPRSLQQENTGAIVTGALGLLLKGMVK